MAPKKKEGKKPSTRAIIIGLCVACVAAGIIACGYFMNNLGIEIKLPSKTIAAGVHAMGVDLGGFTRQEAEEAIIAAIGDSYTVTPMKVSVLDQELEIAPSLSGATLNAKGVADAAFDYGTEENPELQVNVIPYLNLDSKSILEKIVEFGKNFPTEGIPSGYQIIQEMVDDKECDVLEVTIGTAYYDYDANALYDAIASAYNNHRFTTMYSCNRTDAAAVDLDAIYAEHCSDPVEAVLDTETLEVSESAVGRQFDLEAAKEALTNSTPGDVLKFPIEDVHPKMDTETLKRMLFRDELASYTAYQYSGYNRATNLRLACESINGVILNPGDVFSYNNALGKRTAEKGYKPAPTYVGMETVDSLGGGICQVSSALYYATLIADLETVERTPHFYPSGYVPYGMDATVYWGGLDFKFRNNTDFPVRIEAIADGGSTTIRLIGTDTKDYYVKMEYEILQVIPYKTVEEEIKPGSGHQDGEVKTSPYTGYKVQSYKLKYNKDTDELISREKEAYSNYSSRDKVVYKAKKEETKPTEPETTEPKPTETKPTEPKPTEPKPTEPKPTDPPVTEPTVPQPEPEPDPTPTPEPEPEPDPTPEPSGDGTEGA